VSDWKLVVLILLFGASVALTRFLPFLVFKNAKKLPKAVDYLGRVLPAAMMGLLVVYCLKGYNFTDIGEILPVAIAIGTVVGLHLWKRNTILSLSVGTVLYMVLIRVFG